MGLMLLKAANLVTGGMAGIALLLSYLVHYPPATLFLFINIPFFLFRRTSDGIAFWHQDAKLTRDHGDGTDDAVGAASGGRSARFSPRCSAARSSASAISAAAREQAWAAWALSPCCCKKQRRRGWNAGRTQMLGDALILFAFALAQRGPLRPRSCQPRPSMRY